MNSLYIALVIVLIICLLYDRRLFLIVLISSLLFTKRYFGGEGYRCTDSCNFDKDGNPTEDSDIYATQESCILDCKTLVDIDFVTPVPEEFLARIDHGGDLEKEYQRFKRKTESMDNMMNNIANSDDLNYRILQFLFEIRNPCLYNTKQIDIFSDIDSCMYISPTLENIGGLDDWSHETLDILDTLPIEKYKYIVLPLSVTGKSGEHIISGIVDTESKTIHIIDSNITHTYKGIWERYLYDGLLTGKLNDYKLNIAYDYWKDLPCPIALQKAMPTGSCQTWQIYTTLLYMMNLNIPKKELIHIVSILADKSPELLAQLLYYIDYMLNENLYNMLNGKLKELSNDENLASKFDKLNSIWDDLHAEKEDDFNSRIQGEYFVREKIDEVIHSAWYKQLISNYNLPDVLKYFNDIVQNGAMIDPVGTSKKANRMLNTYLHNFKNRGNLYQRFRDIVDFLYREIMRIIIYNGVHQSNISMSYLSKTDEIRYILLNDLQELDKRKEELSKVEIEPFIDQKTYDNYKREINRELKNKPAIQYL